METVNIKELKKCLLPIADESRTMLGNPNISTAGEAHFSALLRAINTLLIFLENIEKLHEESDMKKLVSGLKIEIVKMGEMPRIKKESFWQPTVKEFCDSLMEAVVKWEKDPKRKEEDKPAFKIPTDQITAGHFSSVLNKLKENGEVDQSIHVQIRQKEPYLIQEERKLQSA